MRWAIGVLLLSNLTLAMWQLFFDRSGHHQLDLPSPDVGNLRLLSERAPESAPAAKTRPATIVPPAPQKRPLAPTPPKVAEPEVPEPALEQKQKQPPEEAIATATESLAPSSTFIEPQPAQSAIVPPPAPPPVCWQLPSQASREQAEALAQRLPPSAELLDIAEINEYETTGYYVLIPPLPDAAAARALVDELRQKGVRDTWVFTGGPLRHAISLGLFSRRENAESHARSIRSKGFNAEQRPKQNEAIHYAVRLQAPGELDPVRLRRLAPGEAKRIDCP